jgi:hypothetical protein
MGGAGGLPALLKSSRPRLAGPLAAGVMGVFRSLPAAYHERTHGCEHNVRLARRKT